MQGMRKRAGGVHDTYATKFSAMASLSDGQLVVLYNDMLSLMESKHFNVVEKAYQAGEIYVQMLRVIYTVDRVHDMHNMFWYQNEPGLDYASGVAHVDPHLFLRQVKTWDYYIGHRNQGYIENKKVQVAEANPKITDQLERWIMRHQESTQGSAAPAALTSRQLQGMAESIRGVHASSASMQYLKEDWGYIFSLMSTSLSPMLGQRSLKSVSLSQSELTQLQGLIQTGYEARTPELNLDNDFAKYFARVMNYRAIEKIFPQIQEKILAGFAEIGTMPAHAKNAPSYLELYSPRPVAPELSRAQIKTENVLFEQALLPMLAHVQYQALKANFAENQEVVGMNAILLASFIQGDEVVYPNSIHAFHMQTLDSAAQNPQFMNDTMYALYQDLHQHASPESISQMRAYFQSTSFVQAQRWLKEYAEIHAAHGNDAEASRFHTLHHYSEGVVAVTALLAQKKPLLPREQFDTTIRQLVGGYFYQPVPPVVGDSPNLGAFSQPSFSSLSGLDRGGYFITKPFGELESMELLLRHHEGFIGLPSPLRAKILLEYVLFDGKVHWPQYTQVLNHLFQSMDAASASGEHAYYALTQPYTKETVTIPGWFSQTTTTKVSVYDHNAIFSVLANKQHGALKKLLRHGVRLDIQNEQGLTPLQEATRLDDVAAVMRIMHAMKQRADFHTNPASRRLPTALAVQHNSAQVLQFYVEVMGVEAMRPTLLHEAVQRGHVEAVSVLRQAGFSLSALDAQGKTPMQYVQADQVALRNALTQQATIVTPQVSTQESSFSERAMRYKARFFSAGKGVAPWYVWFKRCFLAVLVLAVTFFALSFIFPMNLTFNATVMLSYAYIFMSMASVYTLLPSTSKVEELLAGSKLYGEPVVNQATRVNQALLYTFDRSQEAIKVPVSAEKPLSSGLMQAPVGDKHFPTISDSSESHFGMGLVK
jgi:hypothetical protein